VATFTLSGNSIEFGDCREIGQAGPTTCTMTINGRPVVARLLWRTAICLRFHPSPLAYEDCILAPLWRSTLFYLVRVNPLSLEVKELSEGYGFMRLLRVVDHRIEFSVRWDDSETWWLELA